MAPKLAAERTNILILVIKHVRLDNQAMDFTELMKQEKSSGAAFEVDIDGTSAKSPFHRELEPIIRSAVVEGAIELCLRKLLDGQQTIGY